MDGRGSLEQELMLKSGESANRAVLETEPLDRLRELGKSLGHSVPRRILELYLEDSPDRLATLRHGFAASDAREIERSAHALRGSSANLGAAILAELCHELESLAQDGIPPGADRRLVKLEAEYGKVERAIRELLAEFPRD